MRGRPPGSKKGRLDRRVMDAVLGLGTLKGEEIAFSQIHSALQKRGVVQKAGYRYKTARILRELEDRRVLQKTARGRYRITVDPEEFQLFDKLAEVRKQEDIARIRIGGFFWTACELHVLGLPENALDYGYTKAALEILGIRLSEIFQAFKDLASEVHSKGEKGSLPPRVLREIMLELPAYFLGSKAGIDGDGLTYDELRVVQEKMLRCIPEEVSIDREWTARTLKDIIIKTFNYFPRSLEENLDDSVTILRPRKPGMFAIIATEAEWNIDEEGYEKRSIMRIIKDGVAEKKEPFRIAHELLLSNKNNVLDIMETLGHYFLGDKASQVEKYYRQLVSSKELARGLRPLIDYMYAHKDDAHVRQGRKQHSFFQNELKIIKREAHESAQEHGVKTMVFNLPLHNEFGGPTPEKEKAVEVVFPDVPSELIHEWLSQGERRAHELADQVLEEIERSLKESGEIP